MRTRPHLLALAFAASLAACGGGGGGGGSTALPRTTSPSDWVAALRYEPYDIHVSLAAQMPPFVYVDAGATNGVYPQPGAFAAEVEAANPGLLHGPCAKIAQLSGSVMQLTDAHGVQAPSYVIFFQPTAPGTCTQSVNLGAAGAQSFSLTVTP